MAEDDLDFDRFVSGLALSIGALSGAAYGVGLWLLDGEWFWAPLCALLGLAIALLTRASGPLDRIVARLERVNTWGQLTIDVVSAAALTYLTLAAHCLARPTNLAMSCLMFTAPVIVAYFLLRTRCAIVAFVMSALAVLYFVIPPSNSFAINTMTDLLDFVCFVISISIVFAAVRVERKLWLTLRTATS
jgi:K+-sensing histidine kinase KdpD